MTRSFVSVAALLSTALFALSVAACGGGDGGSGTDTGGSTAGSTDKNGSSAKGGGSGSTGNTGGSTNTGGTNNNNNSNNNNMEDPGTHGDAGTANPNPTNCPNLAGEWTGTLSGDISGQSKGKVTGTVDMSFVAGEKSGDFNLGNGSKLNLQVDLGLGKTPFTQDIAGTANCGVLDAAQDTTVLGIMIHATAKCMITDSGCSGMWTADPSDKTSHGSGTFTLKKKQ